MLRLSSSIVVLFAFLSFAGEPPPDVVRLGFNYPRTGPYFAEGLDQLRAAQMAVEEVNAAGGILGKTVELVIRDSQSKADVTKANVTELIDEQHVKMVFGGSASNVAVAAGEVCEQKNVPFFGTLTYSTDTTGSDGHRPLFANVTTRGWGRRCSASTCASTSRGRSTSTSPPTTPGVGPPRRRCVSSPTPPTPPGTPG